MTTLAIAAIWLSPVIAWPLTCASYHAQHAIRARWTARQLTDGRIQRFVEGVR